MIFIRESLFIFTLGKIVYAFHVCKIFMLLLWKVRLQFSLGRDCLCFLLGKVFS